MDAPQDGKPFSESNLDSVEYRERLMRKLNCLIAVLEVANAKVRRSLALEGADVEKLTRIKKNLQDTLDVCLRARAALEKRELLPPHVSQGLASVVQPDLAKAIQQETSPEGRRVEMTSPAEAERFRRMGRIDPAAVWACDLDELARRLQG